ncbi:MAG: hypothetical protein ABW208_22475 [Pyrinomonadaceae bacterium]
MRKVLLLLMLFGLPAAASAKWGYVPLEELVQESDLIIVGTLRDVREHTADETDYGEGQIVVREVIWGEVAPGDSLLLKWQNESAVTCPRVEHKYNANEEGVWLLKRDGEAVRADYPGRFIEPSKRRAVEAALERSPVVLRSDKNWVKPGEPMRFSVVYRNVSNAPRTFPGLAFEGGNLRLSSGSRLAFKVTFDSGDAYGMARLSGRVEQDKGLAPVAVPPRGEHRVEIDLREMLAAEPSENYSYDVTLRFDGLPRTNELGFYLGEPLSLRPKAPPTPAPTLECAYNFSAPKRRGLSPFVRAELMALAALVFFPLFYRLRTNLADARLARVLLADRDAGC